jgi:hypothetical protein
MSEKVESKIAGTNITAQAVTEPSMDDQIKAAKLQSELMDLEIKKQELVAKNLEIQERQYNIRDLKQRLAERDIQEQQAQEDLKQQGKTFHQQRETDRVRQNECSHRKGGMASPQNLKALYTGGDGAQRSVIKHRMINNDIWVRCTRCRKTWTPPVKVNYFFSEDGRRVAPKDGVFSQDKFNTAKHEYDDAVKFETRSSTSSSVVCSFHRWDGDKHEWVDANSEYRESMANTDLR